MNVVVWQYFFLSVSKNNAIRIFWLSKVKRHCLLGVHSCFFISSKMNKELSSKLVISIVKFLKRELESTTLDADASESVEVAIQCLESAYNVDENKQSNILVPDLIDLYCSSDLCQDNPVEGAGVIVNKEQAEVFKNEGNNLMKLDNFEEAAKKYTRYFRNNF